LQRWQIKCNGESKFTIQNGIDGAELPDYRKKIGEFNGKCIYSCGCVFPQGSVLGGMPTDYPVFVMSRILSTDDCDPKLPPPNHPTVSIEDVDCPVDPISGEDSGLEWENPDYEECSYDVYCFGKFIERKYFDLKECIAHIDDVCYLVHWCKLDGRNVDEKLVKCTDYPDLPDCNSKVPLDGFTSDPNSQFVRKNTDNILKKAEIVQFEKTKKNSFSAISITPNPTTGKFTLKTTVTKTLTTLRIWNATSQQIFQKNLESGIESLQIDLSGNPPGVYTLFLSNENGTEVAKIVVQ
jgi:Secretion system C-terminal sorting domain